FVCIRITNPVKQAPDITSSATFIPYRQRCVNQWTIRQRTQEANRIKKVRFACTICPSNAGKRSKTYIYIHKILKTRDFETGEHSAPPTHAPHCKHPVDAPPIKHPKPTRAERATTQLPPPQGPRLEAENPRPHHTYPDVVPPLTHAAPQAAGIIPI